MCPTGRAANVWRMCTRWAYLGAWRSGDQVPQTVTRVSHVVQRGARVVSARADRVGGDAVSAMRFAQARCMRLARTNTVRMVALQKHGAAKSLRTTTVHHLGRRVFTTKLGKSCECARRFLCAGRKSLFLLQRGEDLRRHNRGAMGLCGNTPQRDPREKCAPHPASCTNTVQSEP